jgi:hypothetical protein
MGFVLGLVGPVGCLWWGGWVGGCYFLPRVAKIQLALADALGFIGFMVKT